MSLLVVGAELLDGRRADVRAADGRITDVAPRLAPAAADDIVIDAAGSALLPGLHDHHVHLRAAAAAEASVRVGPPSVRNPDELAAALRAAAVGAPPGAWLRAVGYHESVAGPLDREALDRLVADRPVRVQHRSGALWVLNSAGLDAIDAPADVRTHGRLHRRDAWLRGVQPRDPLDLAGLSRRAAAMGITGLTDATPDLAPDDLATLRRSFVQRLHLMAPLGTGETGPVKVLLDDDRLPSPDDLAALARRVHDEGRAVAVHCVTRLQLVVALVAFATGGARPGDRIEHGSVIPADLIARVRDLGLTVVTQPNFVRERGDAYLADVDAEDIVDLYRCRSLLDMGVAVAAGTDAPFGELDPWAAMRAAVERTTADGRPLGLSEAVDAMTALRLFLGDPETPSRPRRVAVGDRADLIVLHVPIQPALRMLSPDLVRNTVVAGEIVW